MGTSTDAYLFRGFEFHSPEDDIEVEWMNEYRNDWEEYYLDKIGLKDDSDMFTEKGEYAHPEGSVERLEAQERWKAHRDIIGVALAKLTLDGKIGIDTHCHGDFPVYFIHLNIQRASRGYSQEIIPENTELYPEEKAMLKEFCKKLDIPYQDPKWILASYWG